MLDEAKVQQIARAAATANLSSSAFTTVLSEPTVDSEGRDALKITIVIRPGAAAKLKGDKILDTLVQIQNELRRAGEDRFPIVEYATKEELAAGGDS